MGLGKTYVGSEKAVSLGKNILIVCQKSKVLDWHDHFIYNYENANPCNLTKVKKESLKGFLETSLKYQGEHWDYSVWIINYELAWRRPELTVLRDFTLILDESSLIQNEAAKRSKFILNKLKPSNIILLSGTPCSGKYEKLWSQCKLLGWDISKTLYWNQYVNVRYLENQGFPIKIVTGYKNVERLKSKLREHGAVFMKTEEVFDLPEQVFNTVRVNATKDYRTFRKHRIVTVDDTELVGDTTLTKMLYERMLCGQYNEEKLLALKDLLESTEDRVLVFYNFNKELENIKTLCEDLNKPVSIINGQTRDLTNYEKLDNTVTLIQYMAGSKGLNLQKANKIIYFTPTLSCEDWMQSQKRIHRLKQNRTCFYYKLIVRDSIEEKIYSALSRGVDYTDKLFEEDDKRN